MPPASGWVAMEERVLDFWRERNLFQRSLEGRRGEPPSSSTRARPPPTAAPASITWSRASFKDLFPRFRTMRGHSVDPQGRVGHPRPAGRDRGREAPRLLRQTADRGLRHRRVQPALPRERLHLREASGERADRAHRLLARPRSRLRHLHQRVHRVGLVACCGAARNGPAYRGLPGPALLRPLRHRALQPRGGAELQGRSRPRDLRRHFRSGGSGREAGGLDHGAVDPAPEHRPSWCTPT